MRATRRGVVAAADTLAWWNALPAERRAKPKAGLSAERDAQLLAQWKAKA